MPEETDATTSLPTRTFRTLASKPLYALTMSLTLACGSTWALSAIGTEDLSTFDLVSFTTTAWALLLAAIIYWFTADDTAKLIVTIDTLEQQLTALTEPPSEKQDRHELEHAIKTEFPEYVKALKDSHPMPTDAIVYAARANGEGRGNRPVIFETQRGNRYSVWKGGRAKGGFSVTKLNNTD